MSLNQNDTVTNDILEDDGDKDNYGHDNKDTIDKPKAAAPNMPAAGLA